MVYFVETEAEEIYQVAEHSEQFVFQDNSSSRVDKKSVVYKEDICNNESDPVSLSRRHASQANTKIEPLSSGAQGGQSVHTPTSKG